MLRWTCLLLLCLPCLLLAQVPESGNWWNPEEPGRGFTVELQDDFAFITGYVYDAEGRSVWLTAQGTLDPRSGVLDATWNLTDGGQCLGCVYSAPHLSEVEQVRFRFSSPRRGEVQIDDLRIPIERFGFIYGDNFQSALPGVWHTSHGLSLTSAEFLWIREPFADLEQGISGRLLGVNRPLLGRYSEGLGYLILLDSSISFYRAYLLDMSLERISGRTWLYRKTEQLSGSGTPFVGSRLAGLNLWQRMGSQRPLIDEQSMKSAAAEALREQFDSLLHAQQQALPADDSGLKHADLGRLQSLLQHMQLQMNNE